MSQQVNANTPSDLEALRQQLKRHNAWPEAGDEFLALISQTGWRSPKPTNQDYELLPEVVDCALLGQDIGAQFPAFFQKLLAHPPLRQDFLAALP